MLGTDAAIDLGTSRTRIYLPQQGVVIDEPSVVAVDNMTEEIIAIGQEAYEMVGRTSQRLTVTYPLVNGVISNFILVEQMVGYFLKKVSSSMVFMPRVVACIPGEVTEVEKRAVVNSISTARSRLPRLWGRELIFLPLMVPWWWISAAEPPTWRWCLWAAFPQCVL